MRNLKSILPILAFVLAIGMSFAFVNADENTAVTGWYGDQNERKPIQVECEDGSFQCQIQLVDEANNPVGGPQFVYPNQVSMTPLPSQSDEPYEILEQQNEKEVQQFKSKAPKQLYGALLKISVNSGL